MTSIINSELDGLIRSATEPDPHETWGPACKVKSQYSDNDSRFALVFTGIIYLIKKEVSIGVCCAGLHWAVLLHLELTRDPSVLGLAMLGMTGPTHIT